MVATNKFVLIVVSRPNQQLSLSLSLRNSLDRSYVVRLEVFVVMPHHLLP